MEGGTTSREGKEEAFAFLLSAEAGRWETITTSCCIVSLRGQGIVSSCYGVKENTLFAG